jgi:hypothetical protein
MTKQGLGWGIWRIFLPFTVATGVVLGSFYAVDQLKSPTQASAAEMQKNYTQLCHTVEPGDNLYSILNEWDIFPNSDAVSTLKAYNRLESDVIHVGDEICFNSRGYYETFRQKLEELGFYEGETIDFKITHYDPVEGGISCNDDCSTTATMTNPLDGLLKKNKGIAACPLELPPGTIIEYYVAGAEGEKPEKVTLVCGDTGHLIYIDKENKQIRLDVVSVGGPAYTKKGQLASDGIFQGNYILPD